MTSIKERQASKAALINLDDDQPATTVQRSEPRTAPGQLMNLQGKYAEAVIENEELRLRLKEGTPGEIPLSQLHEVAGRRRKLTAEQYSELLSNLRSNPLVTPITVRRHASGGYEIVSGHNRVQAYRDLERERILAAVIESDDDQTELNAFYANLLQPDLPDFEKFQGFTEIEKRYPELTRAQIAANAGVVPSTITKWMSFAGLPEEVLSLLKERPELLGANAALGLAKCHAQGKGARVIEAVNKIATGELDQGRAVGFAKANSEQKGRAQAEKPIRIKQGGAVYCELVRSDKMLRLVFRTAAEAEEVQEAIRVTLQNMASGKKVDG